MTDGLSNIKVKVRSEKQIMLAQYFTPEVIAKYMASMFYRVEEAKPTLLDPGAGEGALGIALLDHFKDSSLSATFVEFDEPTFKTLNKNVTSYQGTDTINGNFIDVAFDLRQANRNFSHIILNPPYFKLRVNSADSIKLRQNGIHITNIYAAFVWLSAMLLKPDGQLVAIIPRSFCNGAYFLSFRQYLIDNYSIESIHIFSSRNKAFSKDNVLQENIIFHISKRKQTDQVKLTYSTDQSFIDIEEKIVSIEKIVEPGDASKTIHIPPVKDSINLNEYLKHRLDDLGLMVSTGPIVDFRLKANIHKIENSTTIPLLYPAHMLGHKTVWPSSKLTKKGQFYDPVIDDRNVLPLDGHYVVVRRFSSKEEKRRIYASVVSPKDFVKPLITFENHLNYFHIKKHGISLEIAYGLCAYLNSSPLDEHFRRSSGHTQVNVGDLKRLPYPSETALKRLGQQMKSADSLINDIVIEEIHGKM